MGASARLLYKTPNKDDKGKINKDIYLEKRNLQGGERLLEK